MPGPELVNNAATRRLPHSVKVRLALWPIYSAGRQWPLFNAAIVLTSRNLDQLVFGSRTSKGQKRIRIFFSKFEYFFRSSNIQTSFNIPNYKLWIPTATIVTCQSVLYRTSQSMRKIPNLQTSKLPCWEWANLSQECQVIQTYWDFF